MALNVSPRIRKNRRENRQWLEIYNRHKKRIHEMKPTITPENHNEKYDYLHLQLRLKKLQMEEDRFAQVDYQNRKLLERVMKIMGSRQIDNKSPQFRNKGSLNSKIALLEAERIDRENEKLHDRIQRVRPLSFSAPTVSTLIKETRERERLLLERYIQQQNKELKERISEVKPRLSLSPPYTLRNRPPHDSFDDKFKTYSESLDRENREGRERIDAIMKSQRNPFSWSQPSSRKNFKLQKSLSEDNKYEEQHQPKSKDHQKEVQEEKIKTENIEMEKRIEQIKGKQRNIAQAPKKKNDREAARQRKIDAWQKNIEKENKQLHERLKNIKPVMNTKPKVKSNSVAYEDQHYWENKRLKERLSLIKKGKDPGALEDDPVIYPREHARLRHVSPPGTGWTQGDEDKDEEEDKKKGKEEKVKTKKKEDYIVPEGYRKKFRKTRKISKASKVDDESASNSETDTDTN